jgi:hypothetical protein
MDRFRFSYDGQTWLDSVVSARAVMAEAARYCENYAGAKPETILVELPCGHCVEYRWHWTEPGIENLAGDYFEVQPAAKPVPARAG